MAISRAWGRQGGKTTEKNVSKFPEKNISYQTSSYDSSETREKNAIPLLDVKILSKTKQTKTVEKERDFLFIMIL